MSDKKQNFVSASELSRRAGVTKQTVSRKIKNKILLPVASTESGRLLFDLESSLKILEEQKPFNDDQSNQQLLLNRGGRPKQSDDLTDDLQHSQNGNDAVVRFNNARAAKAEYQAALAKLEVEQRYGTVVSVESVRQQGSELGSVVVNALTNLPDRLSDELATLDDSRKIHKLLTTELNLIIIDIRQKLGILDSE
ncbi:hypothetical protein [Gilliamella apicola]|uniref:hypothetical protein n=1 Tax=Gilliamella apicola TaxID=1196095 RepID=UPI003986C237